MFALYRSDGVRPGGVGGWLRSVLLVRERREPSGVCGAIEVDKDAFCIWNQARKPTVNTIVGHGEKKRNSVSVAMKEDRSVLHPCPCPCLGIGINIQLALRQLLLPRAPRFGELVLIERAKSEIRCTSEPVMLTRAHESLGA